MTADQKSYRLPYAILAAGAISVILGMGIRATLGLYLKPMSLDLNWGREIFAFGMALQNLLWGAFQPFTAGIAEKFGTGRVVAFGGGLYATGLYIMSDVSDPLTFHVSAGLLVGLAQSGCALGVVLGAVARALPDERRSFGLGLVTACGAAGQFTVVPVGQVFLAQWGWSTSYVLMALLALVIVACGWFLRTPKGELDGSGMTAGELGLGAQLRLASRDRSFWLLTAGFFVCGFHVAFIGVHMPAFLSDAGLPSEAGAWSLMLIGVFNVVGSFGAGVLGGRFPKKYLLSTLYTLRAIAIILFISFPITTGSVIAFSVAMGLLWLSTVPLTSGLVALMFGTRYMGTLFGIVFFSHQVGSFIGVWMGGYLYDTTGTYMPVWWAGIVIGLLSAALHLPIHERAVPVPAKA
jgi:predicted MFS family arabinose efflux permease